MTARSTLVAPPMSSRFADYAIALFRIAIGLLWLEELGWKLPWQNFGCRSITDISEASGGLCKYLALEIAHPAVPAYADFVRGVVAPNLAWMGWLIWLMEFAIFISIFFGFLTRLGGIVGVVQSLNLLIGLVGVPGEWKWTYIMLVLLMLLFTLVGAGRVLGVDALLKPRVESAAKQGNSLARLLNLAM